MKPCIILLLLLAASCGLQAQGRKPTGNLRYLNEAPAPLVQVMPQDTSQDGLKRRLLEAKRLTAGVRATYSHNTVRGKVYTLSPDNMGCLAPDMKSVAPMPNRRELFVEDKAARKQHKPILPQGDDQDQ